MAERTTRVLGVLGALLVSVPAALAEPAGGKAIERCTQAAAAHEQMQAEVGAMDADLDRKTAAMNAATGEAKLAAMADLLNTLVSQRHALDAAMARVHTAMLGDCPTLQGSAARGEEERGATSGAGAPGRP